MRKEKANLHKLVNTYNKCNCIDTFLGTDTPKKYLLVFIHSQRFEFSVIFKCDELAVLSTRHLSATPSSVPQ